MKTLSVNWIELLNISTFSILCHIITFSIFFGEKVCGQCLNGFEKSCGWYHDEKTALKWAQQTDSDGDPLVVLTNCERPNCGTGIITTSWLAPRREDAYVALNYKIYGYSEVYLRIYVKTEDGGIGQHQIFSEAGNYANPFPTSWSMTEVRVPASSSRHKLLIKAQTPYKEAYVAVKDIVLAESNLLTSTVRASKGRETEEETTESNEIEDYYDLKKGQLYSWNGALNTQAFFFLNSTYPSTSFYYYTKYLYILLTVVLTMRRQMN